MHVHEMSFKFSLESITPWFYVLFCILHSCLTVRSLSYSIHDWLNPIRGWMLPRGRYYNTSKVEKLNWKASVVESFLCSWYTRAKYKQYLVPRFIVASCRWGPWNLENFKSQMNFYEPTGQLVDGYTNHSWVSWLWISESKDVTELSYMDELNGP